MAEPSTRRRQRHLIDFDNPPPRPAPGAKQGMSMNQVQRWVSSALAFVTLEHLAGGIVVAAVFTDDRFLAARVALNVLAAVTGIGAVVLARVIHSKPLVSSWLLVGLIPGLIGAWLCFR